ncbi:MAG: HEAT repeat domain-containing protein [Pirellulales bacterium]|nr:HEAT repeat domain-containing protein [Pirellulales bacterium]
MIDTLYPLRTMGLRTMVRGKKLILLLVLTAIAVVGSVYAARPVGEWLLAKYYLRRLETVEGREARVLLNQAADLGERGIEVLVVGLGSSNESVSQAAAEVIRLRMEDWKALRPRYSSPLLARLAVELADSAGYFDAEAGTAAAQFAEEILSRRLDRYAVDRCRVISACQKVIRAAEPTAASQPSPQVADLDIIFHQPTTAQTATRDRSNTTDLPITRLAALPGGGLPNTSQPVLDGGRLDEQIDRITNRFAPGDLGGPLTTDQGKSKQPAGNEPRWFNVPMVARPLGGDRNAQGNFNPSSPGLQLPDHPADGGPAAQEVTPHPRFSNDMSKAHQSSSGLSDAKTEDLLHQLNSGDASTAATARNELQLRGFKDVHFRVAAKLCDPNPAVRAELARKLPGVRGINPQPWLLMLARDVNGDVRLAAITLLATAADPSVLDEVEALARQDIDRRVRQQADSIAQRRALR